MKIDLTFKKSNADALVEKYRVYRSTNKAQLYAGENIIGEITNFSDSANVTFTDPNAVLGVSYYYGLETVSKTGYSFMTAPKNICVAKNIGAIAAIPTAGDYDAGYCDISTVTGMSVFDNLFSLVRSAVFSAMTAEGITATPAFNALTSDQKGTVTGYYKGLPTIYYPAGVLRLTFPSVTGNMSTNKLMKGIAVAIAKYGTISYDGDEYNLRLLGVDEWKKLFLNHVIDMAMTNKDAAQPLVPVLYSTSLSSNTPFCFVDEATGVGYGYDSYPSDKGPNKINDSRYLSGSNSLIIPVGLTPVQY